MNIVEPEDAHFDTHQSVTYNQRTNSSVNNYLIKLDDTVGDTAVPDLAKSWQVSQDGTAITFLLNSGVQFHDGKPLTCADVQYSFQRIINPPSGMISPRKGQLTALKEVQCADQLTVVFKLSSPWPDAMLNIADPFNIIYPKHIAEPNDKAGKFMKTDIIGSGAFKFKRYVVAETLELERNGNYWKPGLPYLDGLKFFYLTTGDYSVWLAGFQSGRFDWINVIESPPVAKRAEETAKGRYTVQRYARILFVNFVPDQHPGSVWRDAEVRKAAALALIQDEFQTTMCDIAFICFDHGMFPTGSKFALPEAELRALPAFSKNAAARRSEARRILEAKGLVGHKFEIISRSSHPAFRDSSVVACDLLNKVGFQCSFRGMEDGRYYDMVDKRQIPTGQAVVHSIAIGNLTPDAIIGQTYHPDGVRNYGAYEDPNNELRQLFDRQALELDEAKRIQLVQEYQRKFLSLYHHAITGWRGGARLWWNYMHGPTMGTAFNSYWPIVHEGVWKER